MQRRTRQAGAALLLVVWVVALLSFLAASALQLTRTSSRISSAALERLRLQSAADGAMNLAVLELAEPGEGDHPHVDGTERSLRIAGSTVKIRIWDEAGKLDVNHADEESLKKVLANEAQRSSDGSSSIQALLDFRKRNPARSGFVPFRSLEELAGIAQIPPDDSIRLGRDLTCYTGASSADSRYASEAVRQAIQPGPGAATSSASESGEAFAGRVLLVESEAAEGEARFVRRAIIRITGDSNNPVLAAVWDTSAPGS